MNNKKNIDRLFQEKFKDFEVAPNDAVWNRINESLPNKKKKRRVIALWWQIGGVAALIALLLTVGISVFNSNSNNRQSFPVVNTEDRGIKPKKDNINTSETRSDKKIESVREDNLELVNSDEDEKSINSKSADSHQGQSNGSNQPASPKKFKSYSVATASESDQKKNDQKINLSQNPDASELSTNKIQNAEVANNTQLKNSTSNKLEKANDEVLPKSEMKSLIEETVENSSAVAENNKSNTIQPKNNDSVDNKTEIVDATSVEEPKKQSIEEAIAENTKTIDEKEEDKPNRWSIAPNVAPVYYSSLGQGSSLDQQFNNNSKSSAINMSYGITGAYAISKKLKIRAGINRVDLNQTTSDVFAFASSETAARSTNPSQQTQSSRNIKFNGGSNVVLMSSTMLNGSAAPELFNTQIAGEVDQRFGFIEIPLELEYRLIDKKFGVNVIGGFSTFFLNENEIYADVDGTSTLIGEANNINNTSFSANLGLGLDYKLARQWHINLEPQFKYQINTFNNTFGNFRPFFIGVYTGLSFKF